MQDEAWRNQNSTTSLCPARGLLEVREKLAIGEVAGTLRRHNA